jgi:hypothetical protein
MLSPVSDVPLSEVAGRYGETILAAIQREYPNDLHHRTTGPDDRPLPHEVHPAFYGCFDWHSCVEMHWALVRLLRLVPEALPAADIRGVLDRHLSAPALASEAGYLASHRTFKRPYGWGWALTLGHELSTWDDPDARRWAANIAPLTGTLTELYLGWLPRATYPSRDGAHLNSAFGLARALPWAAALSAAGDPSLLRAIRDTAVRWYRTDTGYPARWEPGGADFLSPALTEAELMSAVLDREDFRGWFDGFLPRGELESLAEPAVVSDPTDGLIAHLHGLNLYRAYVFRRLAAVLPDDDPRVPFMAAAAGRHAAVSLPAVTGEDYMVEHWLACYAVLLLS